MTLESLISECEIRFGELYERQEELYYASGEIPRVYRSVKYFPTGSQFEGTWDLLGMSGYGVYTFSNGVKYEGEFGDGVFNGQGVLMYPSGVKLRGTWKDGELIRKKLIFSDGMAYKDTDWKYCKAANRRFAIEYKVGLQPAGRLVFTAEPTTTLPPGFYDTGDGIYDPKTKYVYEANDLTAIVRSPSEQEQRWIMENCRSSLDVSPSPHLELYANWLASMKM